MICGLGYILFTSKQDFKNNTVPHPNNKRGSIFRGSAIDKNPKEFPAFFKQCTSGDLHLFECWIPCDGYEMEAAFQKDIDIMNGLLNQIVANLPEE